MKISFMEITLEDINKIIFMMGQLYKHDNIVFEEELSRKELVHLINNSEYGKAFNIYAGDQIAGYLIITFCHSIEFRGKNAIVDELFISEEFRRKGLGTEALKFTEKFCRDLGIKAMHLEVEKENYNAQEVYRKFGFKDHNRYLMTKWI